MSTALRSGTALAFLVSMASCASVQRHAEAASASGAESFPPAARELTPDEQVAHVLSRLTFGARPGDLERVTAMGVDRWISEQLRADSSSDSVLTRALASNDMWSKPTEDLESFATRSSPAGLSSLTVAVGPATMRPPGAMKTVGDLQNGMRVYADSTRIASVGKDSLFRMGRRLDSVNAVRRTADSLAGKPLPPANSMRMMISGLTTLSIARTPANQTAAGKLTHAQLGDRQLQEVLADFWENHFSLYSLKTPSAGAIAAFERDAIRSHALGKFRDLLGAVAHSPAMLYYLDNHLSRAGAINENYGRELLELHTMGADGGYTQRDVVEVARALTGWGIDPKRSVPPGAAINTKASFVFLPSQHDATPKVVLGRRLAGGRGVEDGEDVLDIIARHPATAHYIALKLCRHLVSDDPPSSVVDRAAATFTRTDGVIAEVVRTIVTSPEFFSRAAFRAKVKTPFEFMVSVQRAFGAPADSTAAAVQFLSSTLGQPTFGRLTPDGWPDRAEAWMTPGAVYNRITFGSDAAAGKVRFLPVEQWTGWDAFATAAPDQQAAGVIHSLLGGIADPAVRELLLKTDGAATSAHSDAARSRLRDMVALALGSPDFQRR